MSRFSSWINTISPRDKKLLVYGCTCIVTVLFYSFPTFAETACNLVIPASWKDHFPFDLVYPVGAAYVPTTACPTINFWGTERQVCSIMQLTAVLKNLILARITIKGLFEL